MSPKKYELDKDYFCSNQYSKETCIFLDKKYNTSMAPSAKHVFRYQDRIFLSAKDLAKYMGIHSQRISDFIRHGKIKDDLANVDIIRPPEGFVYRKLRLVDQITNVIEQIKSNPDSRRLLVVAYNPGEIEQMALPPCNAFFQFFVANGKLSCQLYQRSGDVFLGIPFNIASYALLTHMVAQVCALEVGEFIHTIGDAHLYLNHIEQAKLMLSRKAYKLPTIQLNKNINNIFDFKYEDVVLLNYKSHEAIKAPVAV